MLDIIRVPISFIINLCYKIVPNYAVALLFFALIMKILLFPLGIKQQKNMVRQAKLRPKEQAIRNRYAGRTDKVTQQKMNQEIMNLYQEEKFNPASGCLPMLIQLVIVFSLYQVVINPLRYVCNVDQDNITNVGVKMVSLYANDEIDISGLGLPKAVEDSFKKQKDSKLEHDNNQENKAEGEKTEYTSFKSPFTTDIQMVNVLKKIGVENFKSDDMLGESFTNEDLPDFSLFSGKFDLSKTPSMSEFNWLMIIPLLTFVFTFGSMKLTKKFTYQPTQATGDAAVSMKIMDFAMPLMSTFFTFSVPAVVAVYWIYQNVFATVQQIVLKCIYPYPTYTEAEYKAVEREMNKGIKQTSQNKKAKKGTPAHRIDLDEEAEEPEKEENKPKQIKKPSGIVPPANMKDESDRNTNNNAEEN